MKKSIKWIVGLYIFYCLWAIWYVYWGADTSIPSSLRGTSADPTTFLSKEKIERINQYSDIKNVLYLINLPFDWIVYLLLILTGVSKGLANFIEKLFNKRAIQLPIFLFLFLLITTIATIPIDYIHYNISKKYGLVTQSLHNWIREHIIDYWVNYGFMVIIFAVIYWLIKKTNRKWWLYTWILSVPFTLFIMFIQPVIIDPLYNTFTPIYNKQLEEKILDLAKEANIPANHVYQVDMSEKTTTLNAYVTGIGANSRIVLWDTTLQKLSEEEILFIMAHEMAHYVKKHVYWGLGVSLILTFFGLGIMAVVLNYLNKNLKWREKIGNERSFSRIPVMLVLLSFLSFLSQPALNAFSRYEERVSDRYAIQLTNNSQAAKDTFHSLIRHSLSEMNPPLIIKHLRYSHPTMVERLEYIQKLEKEESEKNVERKS